MNCCGQSGNRERSEELRPRVFSAASPQHQVVDQQPDPRPYLHHPAISNHLHVAHHGSSLSWSSLDSPPLPSAAPNYMAAARHDDTTLSPGLDSSSVGSHTRQASQTFDEGKLVIAIDFGTSRYEWFKLFLDPRALRDESALDPRLPSLPPGKKPTDLITEFLSCLWEHAREQITRDIGAIADLNSADVWITVPAAWDARGCALMRQAAIASGLVQSAYPGDNAWRDRLKIITEPEAAAVHCAHLTDLYKLLPSQNFIVCDAGGGTVDLAVYKIIGDLAHLEIAEIAARSGANCGSLFLDLRFRALVEAVSLSMTKTLKLSSKSVSSPLRIRPSNFTPATFYLSTCPVSSAEYSAPQKHSSPAANHVLAIFLFPVHSFSEADKLNYAGRSDDETVFYFNCFNVEDPDDRSVGLLNGQLAIPGKLLREAVFDPVVNEVLDLIARQLELPHRIDALLLVGGFSGSTYLKTRIEEEFGQRIQTIARPPDSDTATLRGAARYGLARRSLVSQFVVPRSYVMKVKLPAEPEDRVHRPAFIRMNDAGREICENR
ncbi:heat shock protein 12B [Favolaschia claudopus]|uniref:Heat shock protein 12B n=1 Tax=Favolaschia claudopus TaxID=2862362 RepID=A0AAW0BSZ5_9AGAR